MIVESWSLRRTYPGGVAFLDARDVQSLREAASVRGRLPEGCPDEILADIINHELGTMVILAGSTDQDDPVRFDDQERFKAAYSALQKTIASLSEPLRTIVQLPEEYRVAIEGNRFLDYAIPREPGAPEDWRKGELYLSMLFVFQLMTGNKGTGTPNGPMVRFLRALAKQLQQCLDKVEDADDAMLLKLRRLWSVSVSDDFLKNWFSRNGSVEIYAKVARRIATELHFNDRYAAWAGQV